MPSRTGPGGQPPVSQLGSPARRRLGVIAAALGLAVLLAVALSAGSGGPASATGGGPGGIPLRVGSPLALDRVTAVDGTVVTLTGRPVWLTVGATWCAPCRAEAPDIQARYAAHPAAVVVVAVYRGEDSDEVSGFAQRLGLTYPQVADPSGAVADRLGVVALPTHVFCDATGVIRAVEVGALGPERIAARLREIGVPSS